MSDTCKEIRATPPFTTNLYLEPCTNEFFWVLCILAFLNQILRNFVWIWNSQTSRETLMLEKDDPKRRTKILSLLGYTALSFVLYVFSFLIIVGGNIYFLIAILMGNLFGTGLGMARQKADTHVRDSELALEELTGLMVSYNNNNKLNDREMSDIKRFKVALKVFLENSESAKSLGINNTSKIKF